MQLYLETDELNLIANILLEREGQLSASSKKDASSSHPGIDLKICEELLDRVLQRDMEFDSDELEQLADILSAQKNAINEMTAQIQSEPPNPTLQKKLAKLDRVLERIDEVCAMI
jgi:hypothetical protein